MNSSMIRYVLGSVIKFEGFFMLLPCAVAAIYREDVGFYYLAISLLCVVIGYLLTFRRPKSNVFYLKEGCIATALSWIVLSLFGALPLYISKEIPKFINALFETVSGFTTTGASILSDVESLSHCALFWRSFTHWIGGMGVLVFLLAIIPLTGGSHMNLMRAESPGPSVGKLVPKIRHTARILYLIYMGLTVLEFLFLVCGKMSVFESVLTSLATAGTGGFGFRNDSFTGFSPYLKWVVAVFMILFGINFNAYYYLLFRKFKKAFGMEEVRCYFIVIAVAVLFIFCNTLNMAKNAFSALTDAVFQVGSVITTTGFSTADFDLWPAASKTVMVLLMFFGACAGSTGGGIKISRIMIAIKGVFKELGSYIRPKSVRKIKFEGKPVEHEVVRAVNVYLITFVIVFTISVFAISFDERDLITNFTAVTATINNIGPGLGEVGPTRTFAEFSVFSKIVLIFDMLAGRLELFPMLILFHPGAWRDALGHRTKKKAEGQQRAV